MKNIAKVIVDNIISNVEYLKKQVMAGKPEKAPRLVDRLNRSLEILRGIKPPLLLTKRFVDATNMVIKYILRLRNLVEDFINDRILEEDLYKAIQEYEEALKIYSMVASSERIKTIAYMLTPHITLLATIIYQVNILGLNIPSETLVPPLVLTIIGAFALGYNIIVAHSLNAIASIVLLNYILQTGDVKGLISLIISSLYAVSLFMSISYIHVAYIVSSRKYVNKIEGMLKNIFASAPRRGEGAAVKKIDISSIEAELRKIYTRLYGDKGEEYLRYRVTLLIISRGLSKEEALKRLLDEVKGLG